jgi:RNA polymerase sigma-70 factor, ECF subfamily
MSISVAEAGTDSELPDVEHLSDAELVARCLARDEAAVRVVTGRHNQRLFRIARSILGDASDAEDAVQDAYLKAFTGLERFRGESSFGTWLTRIAINEALSRLRRRRPTVEWEAAVEAELLVHSPQQAASTGRDPESTMAHREIQSLLERSIDELPDAFRVVFVARFVEGMSIEETAALCGLRPETVKTRAFRARRRVRAGLQRRLGASLGEVFQFDGPRCERLTAAVLERLRALS